MAKAHSHRRPKSGGRPTQREAERRLERVLDIARKQFLAGGYSDTSLDAIARASGVAKKTLYHHFRSKAGLFAAILEALRRSWIAELRDVVVRSREPQLVLEAVALHLLEVGTRPPMIELHRLLLAEAHRFPELVQKHYDRRAPRGMEPLHAYLGAAAGNGALRLDDPALAAEQFTHLVLGGVRTRLLLGVARRPGPSERRRIAQHAVALFLHGCAAPRRSSAVAHGGLAVAASAPQPQE
ncbi:MAG TPA: TetR/AcrR family transcriptional regulator [Stellaceae bacterium]|nr:TetR/AcrR family transcriptional regulator [Stellaceae bacterium]